MHPYRVMGGRKHLLSVRKYQERRKPYPLVVSIKLTREISVLTLSVPRELYMTCQVDTLLALKARLGVHSLPPCWFQSSSDGSLSLFKIRQQKYATTVEVSVHIDEHLRWRINILDKSLSPLNSPVLAHISPVLSSVSYVMELISLLESCRLCIGNHEQKFLDVAKHRQALQKGNEAVYLCEMNIMSAFCTVGQTAAVCSKEATVRHKDCHLLVSPNSISLRCASCAQHRRSLQVQAKRMLDTNSDRTAPSSHVNYRYLSRPELIDRLSSEHHQRQLLSKKCQRLKERIEEMSEKVGVSVDSEMHEGLKEIMVTEGDRFLQSLPPNSFQVNVCISVDYYSMCD